MKKYGIICFILVITISFRPLSAQSYEKGDYLVMFYNVENLFDTINAPDKNDKEFTPDGRKNWTHERYSKKVKDIAKVIDAVGGEQPADLIGLAEIENREVLERLVEHKTLSPYGYKIIHFESPDERGIDVALLYRKSTISKKSAEKIKVDFPWDPDDKTRDILYAKVHLDQQLLHVFVNHWSSRGGGVGKTAPKRMRSAALVREEVDKILASNPEANIVVMGDLNDEPENLSVKRILYSNGNADSKCESLFNMSWEPYKNGLGTYHYWRDNEWNMIDQMIISRSLLPEKSNGLVVTEKVQGIFKPDWLLHKNEKGVKVPDKTFGRNYYGGYSDHLPVFLYINKVNN
ncbi:MAG: endonuclease/exonuclease/phosphatase family protein, partial [Bacteroidota bacterium]